MSTHVIILIVLGVALMVMLIIMVVLLHVAAKQQLKHNREELHLLREQLSDHMPPKLKALDDWKVEVHTAVRLAETNRPHRRGAERDEFDRKLFNQILHYEKYEQLFALTDKRLSGFANRIRKQYQLSDRELMFVCLSLISLSDEQIALLMEYSVASIPTTRKRIGQKLGVENAADWRDKLLELVQAD